MYLNSSMLIAPCGLGPKTFRDTRRYLDTAWADSRRIEPLTMFCDRWRSLICSR